MNALRILLLVPCLLSGPAIVAWALSKEQSIYYWFILPAPLVTLILTGLWYLLLGWGPFRRRLRVTGIGVLLLALLGGAAALLLRYDGSTSGTSLPRFRWAWQEQNAPDAATVLSDAPRQHAASERNGPSRAGLHSAAEDSPEFLGPGRDGAWDDVPFSLDWNTDPPRELWRRPVGAGWSSFAVVGDRALTQEQIGEDESVTCLDLFTGERIWEHADEGLRFLAVAGTGGLMSGEGPRATPTVHEGRVYTLGATGVVNCCDLSHGDLVWSKNVIEQSGGPLPEWGKSTSPLVLPAQQAVVVSGPEKPGTTLVALRLEDGETLWEYEGRGASYSSPRLLEIGGKLQIVSVNHKDLAGIDPATGEELWRQDWPGNYPKVSQPVLAGTDRLLATASYGMGSLLVEVTRDGGADAGNGGTAGWKAERLWRTTRLKTKFSSASLFGDRAVGLDEGRIACIGLEDGGILWKGERYGFGQQLRVEDHLLIQAEDGAVVIGRPGEEGFEESGRIEALSSLTWNTPTLAGRLLLVRNDKEAACYLLPEE